ncbi:AraC family transcriptional regulator [Paenibacillus eucommiae]|uniref:AraC-like DNA-binding protein n=1 Tax=Paenibacillus eucommiae TaxID=1355755 RepID=A0ABS4JB52_9BACL|nr:AraC family transcriptional regulator [Paenibacillus eucommiae]MBP1995969.1 AraC-like DNA-binding protein [Paenibacillus eucommiae]
MYLREYAIVNMTRNLVEETGGGTHPFHEILYIFEGSASLQWMGRDYLFTSPALFLLPPNTPHLLTKHSGTCLFSYIELDMQNTSEFPAIEQISRWNALQCDKNPEQPELAPIYQVAANLLGSLQPNNPYKAIAADILLLDTQKLLMLVNCFLQVQQPSSDMPSGSRFPRDQAEGQERIHNIMRFMESNYREPLTVNRLAAQAHLEVSYFIRSFHKIAGRTPLQYLHDLRLNTASSLLSSTKMPILEISDAVGFQSIHYFSRLFKQRYGVSPSLWRTKKEQEALIP